MKRKIIVIFICMVLTTSFLSVAGCSNSSKSIEITEELSLKISDSLSSPEVGLLELTTGEEPGYEYTVTDLGTLGGIWSSASSVNSQSQVVGISAIYSSAQHAYLWMGGVMSDLGTPPGYLVSGTSSLNDVGQIAGYAMGQYQSQYAYVWENEVWTYLGTLPGLDYSSTSDINNAGQIIGYSFILGPGSGSRGWIYEDGTLTDLGTLDGNRSSAYAINERGQVVGWSQINDPTITHAFIWDDGIMTDLGVLPNETDSSAADINELGQVCGSSSHTSPLYPFTTYLTATLWDDGNIISIGKLPGYTKNSAAGGINDQGRVVGYSSDYGNNVHAFIWEDGVLTDLNDLIPPHSGWELKGAADINELGQIVGYGTFNGETRAYLLTPTNSEIIFDNQDPEWTIVLGSWRYLTFGGNAYNGDAHWAQPTTSLLLNTGGYRLNQSIDPGMYDVYIYKFEHPYQGIVATNARVLVKDKYEVHTSIVDLSTPGNEWIYLGYYEFDSSSFQGVVATTNSANGAVIIDAVKLVKR
jgi:probable HAF family extracellular repeat protein